MVILEAKIKLENIYNLKNPFLKSSLKLVISFGYKGHESLVTSKNGGNIYFGREEDVVITIPTGECSLVYLEEDKVFDLYCGKKVGCGVISDIKEIYIEYKNIKLINDKKRCNDIVRMAENMDNALIYEEVYSLLS